MVMVLFFLQNQKLLFKFIKLANNLACKYFDFNFFNTNLQFCFFINSLKDF